MSRPPIAAAILSHDTFAMMINYYLLLMKYRDNRQKIWEENAFAYCIKFRGSIYVSVLLLSPFILHIVSAACMTVFPRALFPRNS